MKKVMDSNTRVFVAGSNGSIGRAIVNLLVASGLRSVLTIDGDENEVLESSSRTNIFFKDNRPEVVFMAGGKSGGIGMNSERPAELMFNNLRIQSNIISSAHELGVWKLLYLASSCCYPRDCPQPMTVDMLMTGPLEPTSEPYATAKIAGIRMCQSYRHQYEDDFIVGIPSNPYGPGDKFDPENSHVIEALIVRMHRAKCEGASSVTIWGTGRPRRDFLFTEDLACACVFAISRYSDALPLNIGTGTDVSISELASIVKEVTGFGGKIVFDETKPDGMPAKRLDASAIVKMGWKPETGLKDGIAATYAAYLKSARL